MVVYALVGESGTGKSYRAMWVAREHKIKYIIDDGLLIREGSIIAGKSAKREKTSFASVRRAIFQNPEDAEIVAKAIQDNQVESILVLGTSERMVNLIAERLKLPSISKYINIHDIATDEEIATAKNIRETQGKHVIPAPVFEVRKAFSGYFVDSLKVFFNKSAKGPYVAEKTIVRPAYSYLGDYTLSKSVIIDICRYEAKQVPGIEVMDVKLSKKPGGVMITLEVIVDINVDMRKTAAIVQKRIKQPLEEYVSIVVSAIDIHIKSFMNIK